MEEAVLSLEQILAAISPQKRYMLEQKITDDRHLADIAKPLTNWKSVCAKLGINEVEEEEIQADNPRLDGQKYVRLYTVRLLQACVSRMSCKLQVRELLRPLATRSFYYSFLLFLFRLALLRKWRSKNGPRATYQRLAMCFYSAERPDMVEIICKVIDTNTSGPQAAIQPSYSSTWGQPAQQQQSMQPNPPSHSGGKTIITVHAEQLVFINSFLASFLAPSHT